MSLLRFTCQYMLEKSEESIIEIECILWKIKGIYYFYG